MRNKTDILPKTYSSLMPKEFRLSKILPRKHRIALCDILRGKRDIYGITGGRGSLKSSLLAVLEMFLSMHGDGDILVVSTSQWTMRSNMDYLKFAIEMSEVNDGRWKHSVSRHLFTYQVGDIANRVIFVTENMLKANRCYITDHNIRYVFVESAESISFETIWKAWRYGPFPRTMVSTFMIESELFFNTSLYFHIREDGDVYKFTCYDVPHEYLGKKFYTDAELFKKVNKVGYVNCYLGTVIGKNGKPDSLKSRFKHLHQ